MKALSATFARLFPFEIKIASSLLNEAAILPPKRLLALASRSASERHDRRTPAGLGKALAATLILLSVRFALPTVIMMLVPNGGTAPK
ncbi:hypothetical protein BST36_07480 [Mycolicibacterium moriokaense]|uniref:hypothetical protein n=1 Tax=Mycolicibacterium moriokaense TaxID=39691 RepID=UPI0009F411B9|nr:hypothetical protein [Mycolicibacterium moriokaense]MCV7038791.1 hypothetical protein [Mycolicibacterium moriokaense]ORB25389.1 hypothetical protein BST36_07480 [Mycolicibacterium moriokaense]